MPPSSTRRSHQTVGWASAGEIPLPQPEKRLLTTAETDGCFVDGISAATGCYVGKRTLRIEDYGKTAATFVDTLTEQAIRIAPQSNIRELAWEYVPSARNRWETQLIGYQYIPDELLFHWQWVVLTVPLNQIIGQVGKRITCEICEGEIINQREVIREGMIMCKSCAGISCFRLVECLAELRHGEILLGKCPCHRKKQPCSF